MREVLVVSYKGTLGSEQRDQLRGIIADGLKKQGVQAPPVLVVEENLDLKLIGIPDEKGGSMPILMSAENPDGAKLEDHLRDLIAEIEAKCAKIERDPRVEAQTVLRNNRDIITHLKQAVIFQEHSQRVLADMAPDQGPRGTPRIGKGSPGFGG